MATDVTHARDWRDAARDVAYPATVVADLESRMRELGEFIREQRRVGQLSLRKLSEMAGISNPYLSQIERGLRKPSAEILQQIARALEISSETLYVRAGILDARDDDVDLVGRDPPRPAPQRGAEADLDPHLRVVPARERRAGPARRGTGGLPVAFVPSCARSPSSPCTRRRWPSRARATAAA